MNRRVLLAIAALLSASCHPPETKWKAIIGAVLIDGTGRPPIPDAVIVTEGSRIRGAGPRPLVPVPAGSVKMDGKGKYVVPGMIDLAGSPAVGAFLDAGVTYVRGALGPVLPGFSTEGEAERLLVAKPAAMVGMFRDVGEIDPGLIRRLVEARVVIAPCLTRLEATAAALSAAQRNTRRLSDAGVRMAIASSSAPGQEIHREIELLAQAGLTPAQIIAAASRNGAAALGRTGEVGTIEAGKRADLLVLAANPLEDARNLRRIERVMVNGEWAETATPR